MGVGASETAAGDLAFPARPHFQSPSGDVVVWATDPPGAVVQMARPVRGTVELARWLVGPAHERLGQRFPGVPALVLVIDLRKMTGRDADARALVIEKAKTLRSQIGRTIYLPPSHANGVYLNTIRVSVSLLALFGVEVEIETSIERAVASLGLRPTTPW